MGCSRKRERERGKERIRSQRGTNGPEVGSEWGARIGRREERAEDAGIDMDAGEQMQYSLCSRSLIRETGNDDSVRESERKDGLRLCVCLLLRPSPQIVADLISSFR